MSYQTWHIPANYTDAGKLFGIFAIRNTIEAVILAGPCIFLCLRFLPFTITTNIIITMIAGIPLGGFALIGVQDDSLSRFLVTWWRWRRGRGVITFRGSPERDNKRRRPGK
jgi:hypothetical protein